MCYNKTKLQFQREDGKNMNKRVRFSAALLAGALLLGTTACGTQGTVSFASPVQLTVWTYYNGDQLETFNRLVEEFNDTVGKERNIEVTSSGQGSVNDLETNVLNAAEGKVGAEAMPNIFAAYADTAYAIDQMDLVVDLAPYLDESDREKYIAAYLEEGDFDGDGSIKIFPTAKSTELMFLNDTDWQKFAAATGADYSDLSTIEGVVQTAEKYYEWTDAQTAAPDDGKALFGRDVMANYLLAGAKELGDQIFSVKDGKMVLNFDKTVVRKLWDNYYVPYIKGYMASAGRFRSDDVKTGTILGYVGSNSSATFLPTQVIKDNGLSYDITMRALPCPTFEGCDPVAVQQGAGMVVTKGTDEQIEASVEFLKWFTEPENNISFSVGSGYMPVTHDACDMDAIEQSGLSLSDGMKDILSTAIDTVNSCELYTTPAFTGAKDARSTLEYCMSDRASADRQTVEERIAAGQSAADAEAEFLTDENFEKWYNETLTALKAYEG